MSAVTGTGSFSLEIPAMSFKDIAALKQHFAYTSDVEIRHCLSSLLKTNPLLFFDAISNVYSEHFLFLNFEISSFISAIQYGFAHDSNSQNNNLCLFLKNVGTTCRLLDVDKANDLLKLSCTEKTAHIFAILMTVFYKTVSFDHGLDLLKANFNTPFFPNFIKDYINQFTHILHLSRNDKNLNEHNLDLFKYAFKALHQTACILEQFCQEETLSLDYLADLLIPSCIFTQALYICTFTGLGPNKIIEHLFNDSAEAADCLNAILSFNFKESAHPYFIKLFLKALEKKSAEAIDPFFVGIEITHLPKVLFQLTSDISQALSYTTSHLLATTCLPQGAEEKIAYLRAIYDIPQLHILIMKHLRFVLTDQNADDYVNLFLPLKAELIPYFSEDFLEIRTLLYTSLIPEIPLLFIGLTFLEDPKDRFLGLIMDLGSDEQIATLASLWPTSATGEELNGYLHQFPSKRADVFLSHLPIDVQAAYIATKCKDLRPLLQELFQTLQINETNINSMIDLFRVEQVAIKRIQEQEPTIRSMLVQMQKIQQEHLSIATMSPHPENELIFLEFTKLFSPLKGHIASLTLPNGLLSKMTALYPKVEYEEDPLILKAMSCPFIYIKEKFFTRLNLSDIQNLLDVGLVDSEDFGRIGISLNDLEKIHLIFDKIIHLATPDADINYLEKKLEDFIQCKKHEKARKGFLGQIHIHFDLTAENAPLFNPRVIEILNDMNSLSGISVLTRQKISALQTIIPNTAKNVVLTKILRILQPLTLFGRVETYLNQATLTQSKRLSNTWKQLKEQGYHSISQLFDKQVIVTPNQLYNLRALT